MLSEKALINASKIRFLGAPGHRVATLCLCFHVQNMPKKAGRMIYGITDTHGHPWTPHRPYGLSRKDENTSFPRTQEFRHVETAPGHLGEYQLLCSAQGLNFAHIAVPKPY